MRKTPKSGEKEKNLTPKQREGVRSAFSSSIKSVAKAVGKAPLPRDGVPVETNKLEEQSKQTINSPAIESQPTRQPRPSPWSGANVNEEGFRVRLEARLEKYPLFSKLEGATGIRKVYFALAFLALVSGVVFRGLGMTLACALAGFIYPVYKSFKTIEQPTLPLLRQWLMYFVVLGLFTTVESFSDTALSWLPLYYPSKLAFLLWCFLPKYNGATVVFNVLVKPVLVANQEHIDSSLQRAHQVAKLTAAHVASEVGERGSSLGRTIRLKSQDISKSFLRNAQTGAGQPVLTEPTVSN